MKPTERFSDRVLDYVRFRPGYPAPVLDVLRQVTGLVSDWTIADVGSGTGLSVDLFLSNGNQVIGVEPNDEMRAAAEERLRGRAAFRSVAGTAEATTLPPGSIDMVVAAQAAHWFDPVGARREFDRILRPGGWIVLLWNTRRTGANAFMRGYEALLGEFGTDYGRVRHDRIDPDRLASFFGRPCLRRTVDNAQALDRDGLIGRVLSSSYTPREGDPARAAMVREVERLFDAHQSGGQVELLYDTEVYVGGRA